MGEEEDREGMRLMARRPSIRPRVGLPLAATNPSVIGEAEWDWSEAQEFPDRSGEFERKEQQHFHDSFDPFHGYLRGNRAREALRGAM